MKGSILSLIACTLGAGTLTIPYIVSKNGLIGGPFWIIVGALLTYYSGRLLVLVDLINLILDIMQ